MKLFKLFGENRKEEKCSCGCKPGAADANLSGSSARSADQDSEILVLGTGCKSCHHMYENTKQAVHQLGLNENVGYITDLKTVMNYGVMTTPALVIDGKVISSGRLLKTDEIAQALEAASRTAKQNRE